MCFPNTKNHPTCQKNNDANFVAKTNFPNQKGLKQELQAL
jgi:hypothetical protein